ncbi:MAG: insulinase family protein [Thermodesulfobacteriota bacterium]
MNKSKDFSSGRKTTAVAAALVLLCLLLASCGVKAPAAAKDAQPEPAALGPAEARALTETCAPPVWPQDESDLSPDPRIVFGRLGNGLRYVLMKNQEPRNRVAMFLDIRTGSIFEEEHESGTAHFLEHMLFNGSTNFPPGKMIHYFQEIGMRYGPDVNAYTGWDETVYHVVLPDGTEKSLEEGLTVMSDYAGGALLLPSEIDRERGVILAEKRQRDSVSYRTFIANMNFLLPGTRAAARMPIGDEKVIEGADQNLLKGFYDAWYRPDRMILVVVGDFDPAQCRTFIENRLSQLSARGPERPLPPETVTSHNGDEFFYHYEKEAGNTEVGIEVCTSRPERKDSVALEKEYLLQGMADALVQNRLDEMKEKPGCPFTSASISSGVFLKTVAFSEITAKCGPENWQKSLDILDRTLRQALRFGFTADEVERVKKDSMARLETAVLKENTRESTALARMIIGQVNDDKVVTSPKQDLQTFGPVISAVTPAELEAALTRSWDQDQRLVQVTGNTDLPGGTDDIRSTWDRIRAVEVSAPEAAAAAHFPFFTLPKEHAKVSERKELPEIGATVVKLSNGVTVNLKKTDFKENEILYTLRFGDGQSGQPLDKPGLCVLAPSVVNDSGLGPLSREALSRALAGTVTTYGFLVREDSFMVSGATVPKEAELLFQILYAYATEPSVRRDAYDRAMERFDQAYQALTHQVEGVLRMKGDWFFADQDPRFGMPDRDVFFRLTDQDVADWVRPALTGAPLELSLVGDLDVEKMIALAEAYLGALPSRSGTEKPADMKIGFPSGRSLDLSVPTELTKGVLQVAYRTTDMWDIGRTRRLAMLGEVFSERLRENVREKEGLTYSPQAWNEPSKAYPGYGLFRAQLVLDPADAPKIKNDIERIAQDLREGGVKQDELARALTPTVTSIKDLLRTNPYWLSTVLTGSSRHPEQLGWPLTILSDYSSITAADLDTLAREYLVPGRRADILVTPEEKGGLKNSH